GSGFNPGEDVDVSGRLLPTSRIRADLSGQVSTERIFGNPYAGYEGRFDVRMAGVTSGIVVTSAYQRQRFALYPAGAPLGQATPIRFQVWGMAPGARLTISAEPSGLFAPLTTNPTDGNGYVTGIINTIATAPATIYIVRAVGATSGNQAKQEQPFSLTRLSVTDVQWPNTRRPVLQIQGSGFAALEWVRISADRMSNLDCCPNALFNEFWTQADTTGSIS